MKKELKILLLTVFLEIIWLWIVIPILPFIIKDFWFDSRFVGITFAITSVWMFIGGMIFGRLSDKFWRKRILSFTVVINLIWYILFAFSSNLFLFMFARFLNGLAWAWISVAQAYISDVSNKDEKMKNMWLIWAVFGIGMIIWPSIWAFFAGYSMQFLWIISAVIIFINMLLIWFFLPETKNHKVHCEDPEEIIHTFDIKHNKSQLIIMFIATLGISISFSLQQTSMPMFFTERLGFAENKMWLIYTYMWFFSIFYQWFLIKYTSKYLSEKTSIICGIVLMITSYFLIAINYAPFAIFLFLPLMSFGYGSINPSMNALIAKLAWKETGKALGINTSYASVGTIIWPLLAWYLYYIKDSLPYFFAIGIFILVAFVISLKIKETR